MTNPFDRSFRLREIAQSLEIALSEAEIEAQIECRYVFVNHKPRSDKTGAIEYFFSHSSGTDDIESAKFVAWGCGSDLPIPDFVIDLDAARPLIEVDEPRTTVFKLALLKRRYGSADRHRVDERVRRRLWGRLRRDGRRWSKLGFGAVWEPWMDLDYETFWSKGGVAGMSEWTAKHAPPITSVI